MGASGAGRAGCGTWTAHLHLSVYSRSPLEPPLAEADGLPFDFSLQSVRLLDASVSPNQATLGGTLTFVYRIENAGAPLALRLGASIRKSGGVAWIDDIGRDKIIDLPSGTSETSRLFVVRSNLEPGLYDIAWTLLRESDKSWLARREDLRVLTVGAGRTSRLEIAGGTWLDRDLGLIGTVFAWNPQVSGQTLASVTVTGPLGWNAGSPFTLGLYQPPGIAPSRSLDWDLIAPQTGEYVARARLGEESLERRLTIDPSSQLEPPAITTVNVTGDSVSVSWTATSGSNSFLVRVNPVPFTGVVTRDLLAGRTVRSLTLADLPLITGQSYQLVVWGFQRDVATPDALVGPFNIASASTIFIAPP